MRQALVVYAKAARPGRVKTRLCPPLSASQAAALHEAFVADCLEMALQVPGIEVRLATDETTDGFLVSLAGENQVPILAQGEGDLGTRMARTFRELFEEGFQRAAIIGSDTPTVPHRLLEAGLQELSRAPLVLGPAYDGGYWLIGATQVFDYVFRNMPWGTAQVLGETYARLRAHQQTFRTLGAWYDVDREEDLQRMRVDLEIRCAADVAPHTRRLLGQFDP